MNFLISKLTSQDKMKMEEQGEKEKKDLGMI